MLKMRLLAHTELAVDEPGQEEGEDNMWTDEFIYELWFEPDGSDEAELFIVRSWFEAQGHGEAEIDRTSWTELTITHHGTAAPVWAWVQAMSMLGFWNDRQWLEVTEEHVKEATAQNLFNLE